MSGIRIGDVQYNCLACMVDISLFILTIPGLQILIEICADYASKRRFTFGIHKSPCMSVGYKPDSFIAQPVWHLGNIGLKPVDKLNLVGI